MISLDFLQGRITYDNLSFLQNSSLNGQIDSLKEDMLQVEYSEGYLLDVGWFPSFDIGGNFQIKVVKDYEWNTPVLALTAYSIDSLIKQLLFAQNKINRAFTQPTAIWTT
ncbi:hypothetical protein [Pseudomonas sp. SED1]|jgi:hypothetical protein|uniref:hypothetical protein n=1 Tax=Pseudomonas sp. SED1 TaxID=3056845 RepID=UPI00296FE8AB|nr:hypothetical protein [Pseudomonas sp. SED1]MDY0832071.1 hypothetical protein [Pseudomonas sp. SED1]